MSGRAALVTGGTGAIGLAIARTLAEEGHGVTLSAHLEDEVEAAVDSLRADGLDARGVVANVAEESEVIEMVAAHERIWGRLDVLVNNAGVAMVGPVEAIPTAGLDRLLAVNLRAVILGTREGLPLLRRAGAEHGGALIVNTASIAAKLAPARLSVYGATKRAVVELTHSTQLEVGAAGIRCTALEPGLVDSAMTRVGRGRVPPERMITPADVGEAVRFLLRTSAACRIPELLMVKGGAG